MMTTYYILTQEGLNYINNTDETDNMRKFLTIQRLDRVVNNNYIVIDQTRFIDLIFESMNEDELYQCQTILLTWQTFISSAQEREFITPVNRDSN